MDHPRGGVWTGSGHQVVQAELADFRGVSPGLFSVPAAVTPSSAVPADFGAGSTRSILEGSPASTSARHSSWMSTLPWPSSLSLSLRSSGALMGTLISKTSASESWTYILSFLNMRRVEADQTGRDYIEPAVPYVIMRLFPALLGLALVPLAFLTLLALRLSLATALLGSLLILFDNALIAQSRLILLDSFLVFFTALTIYFWVRFANLDAEGRAFTPGWWRYLTLTGLSLGAVVSCKWVGLFTIATVGLGTLRQLWLLLGNLKVTPRMLMKHFAARTLCLIIVPITFYMFMFQIHFWILNRSGEGDGFMSSEFQQTLVGHGMEDTYAGELDVQLLLSVKLMINQMSGTAPRCPFGTCIPKEDTCIRMPMPIPLDLSVSPKFRQ